MRTIWFIVALALLSVCCTQDIDDISPPDTNKAEATYFWRTKKKITIYPTESCFKIYRTKTEQEREQRERDYQTLECLDKNPLTYAIITTPDLAATLSATDEEIYSVPTYVTEDGSTAIFSERVIVTLNSSSEYSTLLNVANQYNIKLAKKSQYLEHWYEFACTNQSVGNALEIANAIYELNLFKNVYPGIVLSLTPAVVTNQTIALSTTYRGNHAAFENVSIVDNAEVTVKSVLGGTTINNVQQSNNSKLFIDSHTNISLIGLSLAGSAQFESVSKISTSIDGLSMTQNTTVDITASNITINPGFEISQGCEMTLKIN